MANPFREKRVVRRGKAVSPRTCRDPSRRGRAESIPPRSAINSSPLAFSLGDFYYIRAEIDH